MDTTLEVILILFLVVLSAVFSGMETALVSLTEMKLRRQIDDSKRSAPRMLVAWRDKPNDVLATLLIGNNLVNITASALATDLTNHLLGDTGWGIPIAVGAMTMLVLIFGEVVPKTFAKHNPERFLVLLWLISVTHTVFYPVMRVLVALTRRFVKMLGGETDAVTATVTEEDIEEMVRIGKSDGSMSPVATKLLTGIFELDDKIAREVMVPRTDMKVLHVDAGMDAVVEMVSTSGYSRYPIYRDGIDDIVGVLYAKDFLSAAMAKDCSEPPRVADIMRPPMVRPWNIPVQDLLMEMQRERIHLAVIASEYGGVAGILTLEDIVEEVFGPIYDEHDLRTDAIQKLDDTHWIVEGVMTMRELELEIGTEFPEDEDYETVAGLLMKERGAMPEEGFTCDHMGYRFEVRRADATRVIEVAVMRLDDHGEPTAVQA
ncbi:MAG: HlyC/CorC family transporter [Deltaproteobacteria bacterium]|nr:MAG: HlyC/CorC family transporter [Deltaproteobacteria bacterium]